MWKFPLEFPICVNRNPSLLLSCDWWLHLTSTSPLLNTTATSKTSRVIRKYVLYCSLRCQSDIYQNKLLCNFWQVSIAALLHCLSHVNNYVNPQFAVWWSCWHLQWHEPQLNHSNQVAVTFLTPPRGNQLVCLGQGLNMELSCLENKLAQPTASVMLELVIKAINQCELLAATSSSSACNTVAKMGSYLSSPPSISQVGLLLVW